MVTEHSNRSRAERFIEQINADNAKRLALLLVISFAAYHGMLHLRYGKLKHLTYKFFNCLMRFRLFFFPKGLIHASGSYQMVDTKVIKNGNLMGV